MFIGIDTQLLPQLAGDQMFVTDGGLETDLLSHYGVDLPHFAAFPSSSTPTPARCSAATTRATSTSRVRTEPASSSSRPRGGPTPIGLPGRVSSERLDRLNRLAIELSEEVRAAAASDGITAVVSGCVGPREEPMTADEAEDYHAPQIASFAATTADLVTAVTINDAAEAVGIVRAAAAVDVPAAVSFTVETDGRLATGQSLREAVEQVDADTGARAAYFMVNCAHPTHLATTFDDGDWVGRVVGLRLNASTRSHAELDEAEDLDEGDPEDFGAGLAALRRRLPAATVFGGCCGTDPRHVAAIWRRLAPH